MSRKKESSYVTEKRPFPSRLRRIMQEHGTTQKDLAAAIKKQPQTVSLYVTGQSAPDVDTLRAIADYYNVSADWLLGRPHSTKTLNADVASVCLYTGLSEKAVQTLHDSMDSDKELAAFEAKQPYFSSGVAGRIEWLIEEKIKLTNINECVATSAIMKWQADGDSREQIIRNQLTGIKGGPRVILPARDGARYYRQEAIDVFSSIVDAWIEEDYNDILEDQKHAREKYKDWDRGDTDAVDPQDNDE